jgi:hypothetical protein
MQPVDFQLCTTKNYWCCVDGHVYDGVTSVSCGVWAITPTNIFTLEWHDNAALWLTHVKDRKSLTLHWSLMLGCTTNKQASCTQSSYAINCLPIINIEYCVSRYYGFHSEDLWPHDVWTPSMHHIWVRDNVAQSHSCAFVLPITACRSCHWFFPNIAWLSHLSSSSCFSSISMICHKRYQLSEPYLLCWWAEICRIMRG